MHVNCTLLKEGMKHSRIQAFDLWNIQTKSDRATNQPAHQWPCQTNSWLRELATIITPPATLTVRHQLESSTDKYISPDVINIAKLASNVRHFKFSGCKIGFGLLDLLGSNQSSNNGRKAFHGGVGSAVLHGALNYAFNYNTIYSDKWFTCYKSWL